MLGSSLLLGISLCFANPYTHRPASCQLLHYSLLYDKCKTNMLRRSPLLRLNLQRLVKRIEIGFDHGQFRLALMSPAANHLLVFVGDVPPQYQSGKASRVDLYLRWTDTQHDDADLLFVAPIQRLAIKKVRPYLLPIRNVHRDTLSIDDFKGLFKELTLPGKFQTVARM